MILIQTNFAADLCTQSIDVNVLWVSIWSKQIILINQLHSGVHENASAIQLNSKCTFEAFSKIFAYVWVSSIAWSEAKIESMANKTICGSVSFISQQTYASGVNRWLFLFLIRFFFLFLLSFHLHFDYHLDWTECRCFD